MTLKITVETKDVTKQTMSKWVDKHSSFIVHNNNGITYSVFLSGCKRYIIVFNSITKEIDVYTMYEVNDEFKDMYELVTDNVHVHIKGLNHEA